MKKNPAYRQHSALLYVSDSGEPILYHESKLVPWVLSIPWVHVYVYVCRRYVADQNCTYGKDCEYLHEDSEKIPEGNKLKNRVEEPENILKEQSSAENKMEVAVREMEKVVKAKARKFVYLEEEIVNIKNAKKIIQMNH